VCIVGNSYLTGLRKGEGSGHGTDQP